METSGIFIVYMVATIKFLKPLQQELESTNQGVKQKTPAEKEWTNRNNPAYIRAFWSMTLRDIINKGP